MRMIDIDELSNAIRELQTRIWNQPFPRLKLLEHWTQ